MGGDGTSFALNVVLRNRRAMLGMAVTGGTTSTEFVTVDQGDGQDQKLVGTGMSVVRTGVGGHGGGMMSFGRKRE